jgi:hypothetical protein
MEVGVRRGAHFQLGEVFYAEQLAAKMEVE